MTNYSKPFQTMMAREHDEKEKRNKIKADADMVRQCGLHPEGGEAAKLDHTALQRTIAIKLAAKGFDVPRNSSKEDDVVLDVADDLFRAYREQSRLLENHLCPIDQRIQTFLNDVLQTTGETVKVPTDSVTVDRYGLAREMSFPLGKTEFHNSEIDSYSLSKGGVLHNPLNDKRTTKGVFHVADYGLPIPADKIAVPLLTYARLLKVALEQPSDELMTLPYASEWTTPIKTFVSLMLRPLVCPEIPGVRDEKRMEVRFFVPGGCVANLDFVESIFGNGGDPHLPEHDAALDTQHWTGTTGCVILAPHLRQCLKKDVGLPHIDDATPQQKLTGMCWSDPTELYNNGKPFKITLRDERGIMVTILADNYFGYCKKEVKTQIGLCANLIGLAEEEHAGGALAFKAVNLGDKFVANPRYMQTIVPSKSVPITNFHYTFNDALTLLGDSMTYHDTEGYATDKAFKDIHLLPEDMSLSLETQSATFKHPKTGEVQTLRILPNHTYVHPSGYKVRVEQHPASKNTAQTEWRLIGTLAEPTFCHKPSTVSGGGKSEISKSLNDAVLHGPVFIGDFQKDMDAVEQILMRDYTNCVKEEYKSGSDPSRPVLSPDRTLGSVIKLLTPDDSYTKEHNAFVEAIPNHIRAIVFAIKSCYKPSNDKDDDWRTHFHVDMTNGVPGHELKFDGRPIVGSYLRVGLYKETGAWRTYKLRQDFISADKVQMEDDITASTVVPRDQIHGLANIEEYNSFPSVKIAQNCEWRLFQRPDDAIIPGFDKLTEYDMSSEGLFCSNFQPLNQTQMKHLTEQIYFYDRFTIPMQQHMKDAASSSSTEQRMNICSAKPRMVDGAPTKNPRYLQVRPDVVQPRDRYLAELGARLYRKTSVTEQCLFPVAGVLGGRRNNPPDELSDGTKIRPLCVYGPLHYQELPELFMDYICCVTGKSPSTTGAGSEGALSKGPFNAIGATADLNTMLVSMILTQYGGFSSAAGYIGPNYRVDHDFSLLVPELWCRMTPQERDPKWMISKGFLEKVDDFEHEGRQIKASRLGYRITKRFVHYFFCRIFDHPGGVFEEDMLQPERQDMECYVDGIENICQAMETSALKYFEDGIIEDACPPLKALLTIMAYGTYEGKTIQDPSIRDMFTREHLLQSEWYQMRLQKKQTRDIQLWERHIDYLSQFQLKPGYDTEVERLHVPTKLAEAKQQLEYVKSSNYVTSLIGTLGADPIHDGYSSSTKPQEPPIGTA